MKVLLVDDHAVVRAGLRLVLERQPDIAVCWEAASLAEVAELDCKPDVVVLDLLLPDGRGAETVAAITARFPGSPTLVLTMIDNLAVVDLAMKAGARGYVLKDAAADEVVDAVRSVAAGKPYLQPSLGALLAYWKGRFTAMAHRSTLGLTDREWQVLRLVALGHTNAEISAMLHVAVRTVETHRAHIVQKTGVQTRAQLVRLAQ
ncbi:MAG: response regulator transcription factor, partial [Pseudonocardiaceae bacterium]